MTPRHRTQLVLSQSSPVVLMTNEGLGIKVATIILPSIAALPPSTQMLSAPSLRMTIDLPRNPEGGPPSPPVLCWHCDAIVDDPAPMGWVTVIPSPAVAVGVCPSCLAARYPSPPS